jgi:predicted secreted hydrolase
MASPLSPADWPVSGPIDLSLHDLPHASATTEWWYVNSHLKAADGREFSLFAAFFRIVNARRADGSNEYAHSLTWAISDVAKGDYLARSFVDEKAPAIGLERIRRGQGSRDERLNRAMTEVLSQGRVPLPDRLFKRPVNVAADRLSLDYDGARFEKVRDGEYRLALGSSDGPRSPLGAELTFSLKKPPIRHGDDGVVRGVHGEDMFYVFVPRCEVSGALTIGGERVEVTGSGWYDHEFGAPPVQREEQKKSDLGVIAWNWVSAQLDDGSDVSVYELVHSETKESQGRWAVIIDADGTSHSYRDSARAVAKRAHVRELPDGVHARDSRSGALVEHRSDVQ